MIKSQLGKACLYLFCIAFLSSPSYASNWKSVKGYEGLKYDTESVYSSDLGIGMTSFWVKENNSKPVLYSAICFKREIGKGNTFSKLSAAEPDTKEEALLLDVCKK